MIAYIAILVLPLMASIAPIKPNHTLARTSWLFYSLVVVMIIGLRHDIGADWDTYLTGFEAVEGMGLLDALTTSDPAYAFLNWFFSLTGGGIYAVNFVCGSILAYGLMVFCRNQPVPVLALLALLSYFVVVVGMGYTRQATAVSLELLALAALTQGRTRVFLVYAVLAALFHKTAVILLPLALCNQKVTIFKLVAAASTMLAMAAALLLNNLQFMYELYVEDQMESGGGLMRLIINGLYCIIFVAFKRHLRMGHIEQRILIGLTVLTLFCFLLYPLSSTLADRLGLYALPMQPIIAARLIYLFKSPAARSLTLISMSTIFCSLIITWLLFATHAYAWVPYKSIFDGFL